MPHLTSTLDRSDNLKRFFSFLPLVLCHNESPRRIHEIGNNCFGFGTANVILLIQVCFQKRAVYLPTQQCLFLIILLSPDAHGLLFTFWRIDLSPPIIRLCSHPLHTTLHVPRVILGKTLS